MECPLVLAEDAEVRSPEVRTSPLVRVSRIITSVRV